MRAVEISFDVSEFNEKKLRSFVVTPSCLLKYFTINGNVLIFLLLDASVPIEKYLPFARSFKTISLAAGPKTFSTIFAAFVRPHWYFCAIRESENNTENKFPVQFAVK